MDKAKLVGSLSGLSVKPNGDGGLDGKLTIHFSIEPATPFALIDLMRTAVTVDIERMQLPMFGAPAVDPVTGEIASVRS